MSIVKTVILNDGEGLDHNDLNNAQRYLQAQMQDMHQRPYLRVSEKQHNANVFLHHCYGLGVGGGIKDHATALVTTNEKGVIGQLIDVDDPTGDDPAFVNYFLAANELQTTHAAAHATLDRWDVICLKLEQVDNGSETRHFENASTRALTSQSFDKTRSIVLTKQIVQGTNATPGTAVEPSVPAGYCRWASVLVEAAYASAFDPILHFRDWRVPIGDYRVERIMPHTGIVFALNNWDQYDFTKKIADAAGHIMRVFLPIGNRAARITRLRIRAKIADGGGTGKILLRRVQLSTGTATTIKDAGHTGGALQDFDFVTIAGVFDTGLNIDTQIGPIWGTGYRAAVADNAFDHMLCVEFVSGSGVDEAYPIHLEVSA